MVALTVLASLAIIVVTNLLVAGMIRQQSNAHVQTLGSISRAATAAERDPDDEPTDPKG